MNDEVNSVEPLLARLPEAEPPPELWARILETRLEHERARRRRLAWGAGAAATVMLALLVGLGFRPGEPADELQTLMARTHLLEERLMAYETQFSALDPTVQAQLSEQQVSLMAVDESLAVAYGQGASQEQVEALWRRRLELMNGMVGAYETRANDAI